LKADALAQVFGEAIFQMLLEFGIHGNFPLISSKSFWQLTSTISRTFSKPSAPP